MMFFNWIKLVSSSFFCCWMYCKWPSRSLSSLESSGYAAQLVYNSGSWGMGLHVVNHQCYWYFWLFIRMHADQSKGFGCGLFSPVILSPGVRTNEMLNDMSTTPPCRWPLQNDYLVCTGHSRKWATLKKCTWWKTVTEHRTCPNSYCKDATLARSCGMAPYRTILSGLCSSFLCVRGRIRNIRCPSLLVRVTRQPLNPIRICLVSWWTSETLIDRI